LVGAKSTEIENDYKMPQVANFFMILSILL
jgi:hypothetical protein